MMANCDADLLPADAAQKSTGTDLGLTLRLLSPNCPSHLAVTIQTTVKRTTLGSVRDELRPSGNLGRRRRACDLSLLNNAPRRRSQRLVLEHARPSTAASLTEPRCLHVQVNAPESARGTTRRCPVINRSVAPSYLHRDVRRAQMWRTPIDLVHVTELQGRTR